MRSLDYVGYATVRGDNNTLGFNNRATKGAAMPRVRALTPGTSPTHFFGSEVRRAREASGMPQAELGALVPCDK